ncbi:MAG: OadG family protein [Spirochaetales bacterium]|nr:OadG family protein [Spirochaetales bacterium]
MINQGLSLMALGMGIVFAFLVILIASMKLASTVINRFFPAEEEKPAGPPATGRNEAEIALAIAASRRFTK